MNSDSSHPVCTRSHITYQKSSVLETHKQTEYFFFICQMQLNNIFCER